ncbi:MAG: type II toxin-antitoxin system HicB family antitoxin [Alcaligenaceae bacterium]|nr:type II toxin-antitoxin system HicB family antitoxin [Alcaligenaceae bacterium]
MNHSETPGLGGQHAVITYDPDIEMFRGEFIGLNGGADFYASDVAGLHREGEASLAAFMDECTKRGIAPRKTFSGKLLLRLNPEMHQAAAVAAAAKGESLNQWVVEAIKDGGICTLTERAVSPICN